MNKVTKRVEKVWQDGNFLDEDRFGLLVKLASPGAITPCDLQ